MALFSEEIPISAERNSIKSYADKLGWDTSYAMLASFNYDRVVIVKEVVESWFLEVRSYLDRNFSERIKNEFHQRIWELYCGKLLNTKFSLLNKPETGLPDFKVLIGDKEVWIEATAPDNGSEEKGNKLPLIREEVAKNGSASYGGLISDRIDPVVLRLKTAIQQKYLKYSSGYLRNGVKNEDPFIIAINSHLFDDGMDPVQTILQLFFGMGNQVVFFDRDHENVETKAFREERPEAKSLKGDIVKVGLFQSGDYEFISGVILASKDLYNIKMDEGELGCDTFFILNPFAKNKVVIEDFSYCARVTVDGEGVKLEKP